MQAAMAAEAIGRSSALDESLARAHRLAVDQGHGTVALEHLLFALTDDPEAAGILASARGTIDQLRTDVSAHIGRLSETMPATAGKAPTPGADLLRILQLAGMAARQSQRRTIDGGILVAAIIGDGNSSAAGLLKAHGLTFDDAIRALQQVGTPRQQEIAPEAKRVELPAPSQVQPSPPAAPPPSASKPEPPRSALADDVLAAARARIKKAEPPAIQSVSAPAASVKLPAVATAPEPAPLPLRPSPPRAPEMLQRPSAPPPSMPPLPPQPEQAGGQQFGGQYSVGVPPNSPPLARLRPNIMVPEASAGPPMPRPQPVAPRQPTPESVYARPQHVPMPGPMPGPQPAMQRAQPPPPVLLPIEQLNIVAAAGGLPASVRRYAPVLVEIKIPRAQVDVPRHGPYAHAGTALVRAVTVRLTGGPVSGLSIEPRTPETAWLGPADADAGARDVVWQFVLLPTRPGVFAVTLHIAGRTIAPTGLSNDVATATETFAVKVRGERGRGLQRFAGWIGLLAVGGALGWALTGPLAGVVKALIQAVGP